MAVAQAKAKTQKRRDSSMPENPIICPFCGARSRSEKHCTSCSAKFNREVLAHAVRESDDYRSDRIGPFSTKTAKRLLWVFMILMVVAFVAITESVRYNPLFN